MSLQPVRVFGEMHPCNRYFARCQPAPPSTVLTVLWLPMGRHHLPALGRYEYLGVSVIPTGDFLALNCTGIGNVSTEWGF
ncbi:hypothetical protein H9643_18965 [Ochrobactrum sp. Sa2BUA5]|nr:hypothetical protein [Ochrobactrum gallinarum]